MKKWLFAILFASALVLGACGNDDNADDNNNAATNDDNNAAETETDNAGTETASAADDIFQANCAACHGADLSGGVGKDLTKIGTEHDAAALKDIITNGTNGGMPSFGDRLSEDDIQTLADWLATKK